MSVPDAFLKKQGIKNPKPVIYGAAATVIVIIAIVIIKRIRQGRAGRYTSGKLQTEMSDQLAGLKISSGNLTITNGQATIIAQNLLSAMDRWGTDEEAIIDNISMAKTKDDLLLITQKFGVKPYDGMGLADTFLSRNIAAVMKNLSGWIRAELSGSDLRKVKAMYDNLGVPF